MILGLLIPRFFAFISSSFRFSTTSSSTSSLQVNTDSLQVFLNERGFNRFGTLLSRIPLELTDEQKYTIFVPSSQAFAKLEGSINSKLLDPRNVEVVEKIVAYHFIEGEKLIQADIFDAAGLITKGGDVKILPSTSGGFMGLGAKPDGGITVNGAKIVNTIELDSNTIIHEIDALMNPYLLYRFLDAVKLPGTK